MNRQSLRRTGLAAALLLVAVAVVASGQTVSPAAEVGELRARFSASLLTLEQAHTNRLVAWREEYTRALSTTRRKLQSDGREAELGPLDEELARVSKSAPEEVPATESASPELAALQRDAGARLTALMRQRYEDVMSLAAKYTAALKTREKKYAAANEVERSLAIKAEAERAMLEPAVTMADFELATLTLDQPALAEPASEPEPEPEASGADLAAAAPVDGDVGGDDPPEFPSRPVAGASKTQVYGPGQKPPAGDAAAYKKQTLSRTDFGPIASPVVVNALILTQTEAQRAGKHHRVAQMLDRTSLRVQLRTTPAVGALENPVVVVQFFIKNAKAEGRVEPEAACVERVNLDRLTPDLTTIDFSPVETAMRRVRPGTGAVWESHGTEFYGIIISVFGPGEKLLYQTTTARSLNAKAQAAALEPDRRIFLKSARDELMKAQTAENEARLLFFSNQRIEANKQAFIEASQRYEEARQRVEALEAEARALRRGDW